MMTPKISVVIPVYNGEKFIRRAIQSVLLQDTPAHELIVVDDGSTDGTAEILRSYGDRIIHRRIPNSGGPSKPRNTAIRMATGDYIALLDADDIWLHRRLTADTEAIRRYPDVGFICSNFVVRELGVLKGRLVEQYAVIPNRKDFNFDAPLKKDPLQLLVVNNFVGTPTAVTAKRSAMIEAGLFNENCKLVEDLEFFLRMARREKFLILSKPLFYKRVHGESMSANEVRLHRGHAAVLEQAVRENLFQGTDLLDSVRRSTSEIHYRIGHTHFEGGEVGKAFSAYGEGLRTSRSGLAIAVYTWVIFRKIVRILTGGRVRRRNLDRFADNVVLFFSKKRR